MWSLYGGYGPAIAIQTTYRKMREHLPEYIFIGKVHYKNYETDVVGNANSFNFIMCKRKSFEHEQELRAVIWGGVNSDDERPEVQGRKTSSGVRQEILFNELVSSVYVSPAAPVWYFELVKKMLFRYKMSVPVYQSKLDEDPLF